MDDRTPEQQTRDSDYTKWPAALRSIAAMMMLSAMVFCSCTCACGNLRVGALQLGCHQNQEAQR